MQKTGRDDPRGALRRVIVSRMRGMMCGCDFLRGLPTGELTGDGVGERALVASAAGHAGRSAVALMHHVAAPTPLEHRVGVVQPCLAPAASTAGER